MKQHLSKKNYNNQLIKEMIESKIINKEFFHFLIDDADEEVKHSRINDKEAHYEIIRFYIQLL